MYINETYLKVQLVPIKWIKYIGKFLGTKINERVHI